jgi:hypothetical protein
MNSNKISRSRLVALTASLGFACSAQADGGMVEGLTGFNINNNATLQSLGIHVDGWVEVGIVGNPRTSTTNEPITFASGANDVNVNSTYLVIERGVTAGDSWDLGFRADFLWGSDAKFTTAYVNDNFDQNWTSDQNIAMPQAYAELYAPIGSGVTLKVGHFYTLIGWEVVTAPDNFFYTHAYTMQYGEPFTHAGALISYDINDNISVTAGVTSGWDAVLQEPANFLGAVSYTSDDGNTGVTVSLISGDETRTNLGNRTLYSIVATHDMGNLHYVIQHDNGFTQDSTAAGGENRWYGINQYLTYDVSDTLAGGLRFEWFRDQEGSRVGTAANYFAATAGVNWDPISWLRLRPEIRYDWTELSSGANGPFQDDSGNPQSDQFTIGGSLIIQL